MVQYKYTAYGTITSTTGSLANTIGAYNPFRWKGYYYDYETGMYYCNGRYYVPTWCRWLNGDASSLDLFNINGLNLFSYCGNNPINYKQKAFSSRTVDTSSTLVMSLHVNKLNSNSSNDGAKVNWGKGGFQIPIWIASLLSGSDFGFSVAPALRTLYQYARYPGIKDLNKLYGLDYVPGKLNTVSKVIGYALLGINIAVSAYSNFTNDNLTAKQQWIGFGVDTAY
ncbi:MAG: RHS repeat-associated core domain-containing protein, partial [Bacilli bacterium]|nr:RHS repeat-associated core domain-containing protein [Bacilli bacterium]